MGGEIHWETLPALQGKCLMGNAGKYPKDVRFALASDQFPRTPSRSSASDHKYHRPEY